MATSQDRGFMEQLREMRNTRTQQLRQGSQQAGLLNKQISAITTLNKTMDAVLRAQNVNNTSLRDFNKKQDALIRQNNSVTQGIRNLSSTIDKSIGSLAKSVTSTKASEVKEIKQSKGVVKEDSGSSMMSSLLMKALPFAITGVIGKTMVWDNMDESVKKGLTDSFGNLVKSIFGGIDTSGLKKVTDPITKEFGIVFGALGDTVSDLAKRLKGISDNLERVVKGIKGDNESTSAPGRQMSMAEREIRAAGSTGKVIGEDVSKAVSATKDFIGGNTGTAISIASGAVLATGAYGAAKKLLGSERQGNERLKSADKPGLASSKDISRMQDRLSTFQKKQTVKKNIKELLDNRVIKTIEKNGGPIVGKFFDLLKKFPRLSAVGVAIELGLTYIVLSSVDGLFEAKEITEEERDELKSYFIKQAAISAAGTAIGGAGGLAAAGFLGVASGGIGLVAAPAAVALGGYGGKQIADMIGSQFINVPDVLKEPTDRLDFAQQGNVSKLRDINDPRRLDKNPQGAMTPTATMSGTQQVNLTRSFIDYIKKTEGFRARPYGDYKQLSIGYGTKANSPDEVIDEKEAEKRMIEKLTGFQKTVLSYNNKYGYNWNQSQIDALTSFTYNTGEGNLKKLLGDGKRSNEEIAVKMKEYNIAGGEVNQGLVKRREVEMSLFAGNMNLPSNTLAHSSMDTFSSYDENYARRKKEAEANQNVTSNYYGGDVKSALVDNKPSVLSAFAKQFSVESFTSDFAQKTKELTDVVNSMFAAQTQQAPTVMADNSNVTNIINNSSGGSGGGPSINQVVSTHMSNMNWQFNSMSGGVRA
jgi:GH24 family phage-related lysozyme (muramidase)